MTTPKNPYGNNENDFGSGLSQPNSMPAYPGTGNTEGAYGQDSFNGMSCNNQEYGAVVPVNNTIAYWALGFAVVSILAVLSIVGLVFAFIPALIALVLAIIALVKARKMPLGAKTHKGMSIVSLVLSVLVILASLVGTLILGAFVVDTAGNCVNLPQEEQQKCIESELSKKFNN
ncbi:DUF4190 domain-containing protein [Corynebacterium pseudotuberculosis]|uniref:DUF4190 domain-containing protein n=1 Tax=Corynebacterium pseudotuberculosis (strain C231) TaxID=681645 RepID=D9QAV4_CORP2|nr:DUF4190 domain-containing protein [Corynebacterium pseudotuberculosis]ADK29005.1 DUF4190 domain-containing protein [Corynebacterium pseudotuberculosis FRC41]ADL10680.1 DUF4190 domain-containing protein [Corynebacterium pseudotuberculosis C231]ADL21089.1 DUF4190 domain-containing protein [Corynebacterium pseudotuberculosis 1002]AEK92545.1 Hypothetical protein, SUR7/PalI family [Corynebacterium pseudotuberculosis PAT10]AEP70453.1 Hypothetical protein, SUR7/PalI family [Corynebacterium pseudot